MVVSTQQDETGVVKLGSVGLTDVADLSLSRFAQTRLDTEYDWRLFAAPEVADHAGLVDPRCDLYSLGCILRYLFSGQCPQGSDSSQAKERIRVLWKRTTLTSKRGDVPRTVAEAIERMMAQDPTTRVARTGEVIETLRPFREQASYRELLSDVGQVVARRQRLTGGIHVAGPEIGEYSDASSDRHESTPIQENGFDALLSAHDGWGQPGAHAPTLAHSLEDRSGDVGGSCGMCRDVLRRQVTRFLSSARRGIDISRVLRYGGINLV